MTKREACKVLHLAPSADVEIITQTYWHLARKLQAEPESEENRRRLDELNAAYYALHPAPESAPVLQAAPQPAEPGEDLVAELLAWFRQVIDQTILRWRGHVPEITVLTITTLVLALLALSAGASWLWTLLAAGAALVTVWAPWRKL